MDPFLSLASSQTVIIDQKSNVLESCCQCVGCCCVDTQNSYEIIVQETPNSNSNIHFTAKEDSGCLGRSLCHPYHGLVLRVTDQTNKEVLTINKPFKCCCFAVGPFQKSITIQKNNQTIGYVQQPCCGGCFTPTLDMYSSSGGKEIGTIKGPTCCVAGCCGSDFDAKSPDKKTDLAEIRRGGVASRGVARSLLSTSDKYSLNFKNNATPLTVDEKLVLISSVLFIDYLFFEGETSCLINCCTCPPQCWFKLCEFYFCGCSVPCRVRCCVVAEEIAKAQIPG